MNNPEVKKIIKEQSAQLIDSGQRYGFSSPLLLELIGEKVGIEKLRSVVLDKVFLDDMLDSFFYAPLYVYDFIEALIKNQNIESIFDPCISLSSPALFCQTGDINGVSINEKQVEKINLLFPERIKKIHCGNPLNYNFPIDSSYDLILSFPPINMRIPQTGKLRSPLDFSSTLMTNISELINENGKIIFLMPNSIFTNDKVKNALASKGLYVDAVFAIPRGAFAPMTNITLNLIIVSKQQKEKTFIAQIDSDSKSNIVVLNNYISQKECNIIELGSYVDFNEFRSFNSLVLYNELQQLNSNTGYPPIKLEEIALKINKLPGSNIDNIQHLHNSIYLPKIGKSPVVTNINELMIKAQNYYQIQLDETKANSIFVANLLNSPIGLKVRKYLESGYIPQINKSSLKHCKLYLPNLNEQIKIIEVDNKLQEYEFTINDLKRKLWKYPKSYKKIKNELKLINQDNKLENWIDQIPFPISSILWRYNITKNNSKKIEHLFHFFEAFSEFYSMLILSAFIQDKDFYQQESYRWNQSKEEFRDWYLKSTFGNWNVLSENLSKAIRVLLQDKDKNENLINLLGNPSESFLSMISSKSMINILNEVGELRNQWKGHSGICGEEDNKQRVSILEQKLNIFKKSISDAFDDIRILSPTTSIYQKGIYLFNVKELVGSRTPFKEIIIQSLIPLDSNKLYVLNNGQKRPIELLPFIKFVESSCAIYFYTSIKSRSVRWVSYHFEKESEFTDMANEELFEAFELLK